ncbi:heme NO-binding domain-containing protein [Aquimarina sp. ERC-38]|uniref:heme NO-binding domain-containing protein n=1 Tax=Aquimarina sp. ERC-38 TaxID=2949996 RepID=UPI002247E95E|nr:heme NO-binding domain-containing protein [Aquimarina sp. ERC-38]UZO82250.1 heme NO-binding domain-containing protein [Aquimarina sp. ERC-38]
MKGIVFTEFLDLVESKFGLEMVDRIITQSTLNSNGAYTAIGTYKFSEMAELLTNLSLNTGIDVQELLLIYGEHFFTVLQESYGTMLRQYAGPIELLNAIENHIHVEVRKIYPEAELPSFEVLKKTDNSLIMIYKSDRAMYSFGLGLMRSAFRYFDKKATITYTKLKTDGTEVKFDIYLLDD